MERDASGQALPTSRSDLLNSRVLIVDDDADIRLLLATRLAGRGFQVKTSSSGEEALTALQRDPTDLVFLDVAMTGMSGLEVLEQIRAQALDVAVILTTAFGSEQVAIEALRQGADDYLRKPFDRGEFQAVLDRTSARLALTRQNQALRRRLDAELARAAEIQADLLPGPFPSLPGFDIAARCLPARQVGGDFYDWQLAPGLLTLSVADVMGKGMPAALLMATVRAVLRGATALNAPGPAVRQAATTLDSDLSRSGSFVTLFHAQLQVATGRLRYVDAGHGHVLLRRASGATEGLPPCGLPLGVLADEPYAEGDVTLGPGDVLVVYSDGLTDARPDLMGSRSALAAQIADVADAPAIVDRLIELTAATRPLPDDLTIVVVRRT